MESLFVLKSNIIKIQIFDMVNNCPSPELSSSEMVEKLIWFHGKELLI
jgi:hypothetical protein